MQFVKYIISVLFVIMGATHSDMIAYKSVGRSSLPEFRASQLCINPWPFIAFGYACLAKNYYNYYVLKKRHTFEDTLNGRVKPTGKLNEPIFNWKVIVRRLQKK